MSKKTKKLWYLTLLLALDFALLILISSAVSEKCQAVHLGSCGEKVIHIQTRLAELGFFVGECDGLFSPATRTAVRDFQQSACIEASGDADFKTVEALGINSRTGECFTAEAELLARCIALSECISYPEMVEKGIEILKNASGIGTLASYAVSTYPDLLQKTNEPMCEAYSAAVQAMRIFLKQPDSFF